MNDDVVGRHTGRAMFRSCQELAKLYPNMSEAKVVDRVLRWMLRSLAANCIRSFGEEKAREMFTHSMEFVVAALEDKDTTIQHVNFKSPPK